MNRLNIWMSKELHRQLKVVAALKGMTIQDYIEAAVKSGVEQDIGVVKDLVK